MKKILLALLLAGCTQKEAAVPLVYFEEVPVLAKYWDWSTGSRQGKIAFKGCGETMWVHVLGDGAWTAIAPGNKLKVMCDWNGSNGSYDLTVVEDYLSEYGKR